jgi:GNAT superfamily N-acetyltransferase
MFNFFKRREAQPSITFHELTDLSSDWGQQALAIYENAFPIEERETLDSLTDTVTHAQTPTETHHFRVLVGADGHVQGIAIFTTVHAEYMAFLRFIAIHADLRSQGYGRWLLRDVVQQVKRDGVRRTGFPYLGVVLEVERPGEATNPDEQQIRERRIGWYRRNGAKLFADVDLITPPAASDLPPMHYHVMFVPAVPKRMMSWWLRRMIVNSILVAGYGETDASWYVRHAMEVPAKVKGS